MRAAFILAVLVVPLLARPAAPDYDRDIAPLLAKRCGGCHTQGARLGEFQHNTYSELMRGGNHGTPVVPGKAEDSLLYQMVIGDAYPTMPMDGTHLSKPEAELIRAWINSGAKGPAAPSQAVAKAIAQGGVETAPPKPVTLKPRGVVKPQIFAMAWQPGGSLIAAGGYREVRLISPATRQTVATLTGLADTVRGVAFSRDGKMLAVAGGLCAKSGEVVIFDVATRERKSAIAGHADCVYGVAFSPDGRTLATSSYDKLIKIWDAATGAEIRTLKDHIDSVYTLEFTPDGKRLISGAADRAVKVWDPATGKRLYTLSEPTDGINTIAVDPAGKRVAAGGADKSIRVWSLGENGAELVHSLMAHEDAILRIAWSPDGETLASSAADKSVKLLRAGDLTEIRNIPRQSDWAYGLVFSPDGKSLAIGRMDGSLDVIPPEMLQNNRTAQR